MESKSVFNDSKICGKVDIAKHDRYNPLIHDCSRKLIGSTPYFFDGQDSVMNKIQALSLGYSLVVYKPYLRLFYCLLSIVFFGLTFKNNEST